MLSSDKFTRPSQITLCSAADPEALGHWNRLTDSVAAEYVQQGVHVEERFFAESFGTDGMPQVRAIRLSIVILAASECICHEISAGIAPNASLDDFVRFSPKSIGVGLPAFNGEPMCHGVQRRRASAATTTIYRGILSGQSCPWVAAFACGETQQRSEWDLNRFKGKPQLSSYV